MAPLRAPSHAPADEIVVRTDRFAFHMGARVDETWPRNAERTRAAIGAAVATLLDDEDTVVPVLARALGVTWPDAPLDFDVVLGSQTAPTAGPCDAGDAVPRRLEIAWSGEPPASFFACVLARSFARLPDESGVYRGMKRAAGDAGQASELSGRYGCVVTYAIAAVQAAGGSDKKAARAIERSLLGACTLPAVTWLSHEWVKRVRDEEGAEAFGARAEVALRTPE